MARIGKRDWRGMGCAAVLAASIAFPVGLMVGRGEPARGPVALPSRPLPAPGRAPSARNPYSPRIASDPYVIEQQREVLRSLEASCRQSQRLCPEAEQARRRIEEAEAGR